MPTNLHLFSSPGDRDIRYIVDASRAYLEGRDDPLIAYLPLASLSYAPTVSKTASAGNGSWGVGWLQSSQPTPQTPIIRNPLDDQLGAGGENVIHGRMNYVDNLYLLTHVISLSTRFIQGSGCKKCNPGRVCRQSISCRAV